ncbi:MAG: branched-chain amino acid transaminase [Deltaproteobacteria bacterium]|nr:branched-chain amino acid transaminase [Deltaproteobacteria bacterium]
MVQKSKKIWLDGKLVDWDEANVHVLTHTLHYGVALFEGIRCYELADGKSAIFRLREHIRRMFDGCRIFQMKVPFSEEEVSAACVETVKVNGLKSCYLRPVIFCGDGEMGVYANNPTRVTIATWPWGEYLGKGAVDQGVRVKISSFARHHVNAGMSQGKVVGQYANAVLAKREAVGLGYEEAVMLDVNGYVAEGAGENIFAVKDGVIRTPPLSAGILNGITRQSVIALGHDEKLDIREENLTRDFLYIADEVFFTGTAAEVTPIREIDDRSIGTGKPGPMTKRLQRLFFDVVRGKNDRYREWLTPV